jgi:hypothetical protein
MEGDYMKKILKLFCMALIAMLAIENTPITALAASNKTVKKAYAKALENGKIKYKSPNWLLEYALIDINGDGVKDLIINVDDIYLYAWTYKKGKITTLFKKYDKITICEIYYDKSAKKYWISGECDGAWYTELKIKNKQLKETAQYFNGYEMENNKVVEYAEKKVGNKTTSISVAQFKKIEKKIQKKKLLKLKSTSKSKLIKLLKK